MGIFRRSSHSITVLLPDAPAYDHARGRLARILANGRGVVDLDLVLILPDLLVLLARLMVDPRTVMGRRLRSGALLTGAVVPVEDTSSLKPDRSPKAKSGDRIMLLLLAARQLLQDTDPELLEEHWPGGKQETLSGFIRLLDKVTQRLPERLQQRWMVLRPF